MAPRIVHVENPAPEQRKIIVAELSRYNERHGPPSNIRPLALFLHDEGNAPTGGLWGRISYDWLFIELLVVPEEMRGQKLGTALLEQAETIARQSGCVGAWLDTFSFQALGFYEKHGYSVFGQIDDHPLGGIRYFVSKRF
ncbi:MAG: family acetyltransferase [Sphingomonas bacterium]|jgi:GNAT superfamily N-acetyltransferase|nr:family acetyltransferase [Sphingomonas bacterium]